MIQLQSLKELTAHQMFRQILRTLKLHEFQNLNIQIH
jgi:hypothetical protein